MRSQRKWRKSETKTKIKVSIKSGMVGGQCGRGYRGNKVSPNNVIQLVDPQSGWCTTSISCSGTGTGAWMACGRRVGNSDALLCEIASAAPFNTPGRAQHCTQTGVKQNRKTGNVGGVGLRYPCQSVSGGLPPPPCYQCVTGRACGTRIYPRGQQLQQ